MSLEKKIIFQVRNRLHEVEGSYTEEELLKRIEKGKYTGIEEVSHGPNYIWQKISSHPVFYDAFLKRIFSDHYQVKRENTNSENRSKNQESKRQTQVPAQHKKHVKPAREPQEDERAATMRIDSGTLNSGRDEGFAGTIHQEDIDKLFSENSQSKGKEKQNQNEEKNWDAPEELLSIPLEKESTKSEVPLNRPLDIAEPLSIPDLDQIRLSVSAKGAPGRRVVLWTCLLAGLMVLLFQMGQPSDTPKNSTELQEDAKVFTLALDESPIEGKSRGEIIKALTEEADSFYEMDTPLHYIGALNLYSEVAYLSDKDPVLYAKMALAGARALEKDPTSTELLEKVKRAISIGRGMEPYGSGFYLAESIVAFNSKNFDVAKEKLLEARESDPTDIENSLMEAELFYTQGALNEAKELISVILAGGGVQTRVHYVAAQIYLDLKDYDRAKQEVEELIQLNPLHANGYFLLGRLLLTKSQTNEAKIFYDLTTRLAPLALPRVNVEAQLQIASLEESSGDKGAMEKRLALAWYYSTIAKLDIEERKSPEITFEGVEKLAKEAEYSRTYFETRAEELLSEDKLVPALKFYQTVRLLHPQDASAMVNVGDVLEKMAGGYEDYRRVVLAYQRAIYLDPNLASAYMKYGNVETEQHNFQRGYELLNKAMSLANDDSQVLVSFGKHYYKRQDYAKARDFLGRAASINSADSQIYYYYGLLTRLYKKDMLREAMGLFYQAYTLDSKNFDALNEWIKLKVLTYEKLFAIKYMRALMETDGSNAHYYWILGELYAANKEFRRAISYYHKSLDRDNRLVRARMSLARSLVAVGELESAIDEFTLAGKLDKKNAEGFFEGAGLLIEAKNYKQAEELLKLIISNTPNYPGSHRLLSKVYQALQKKEMAISEFGKEVENNPQNTKFLLEYADLYMGYALYPEAIKQLSKITALPSETKAPEYKLDRIRAFLLLSRSFRAQNRPESSEGAIKLALNIDSNDPELHRELGYVYHALQRDREGVREFEIYLQRNPAARDAETVKELMKQMLIEE